MAHYLSLSIWGYCADVYLLVNNGLVTTNTDSHTGTFFPILFPLLWRHLCCADLCNDFSLSGQMARTWLWVIAAAGAFYVSQFLSRWRSTCFYKSSPLRNTCTEQQESLFSSQLYRKVWKSGETTPGRFAESLILVAPRGWLKSSCQKHSIMRDVGLDTRSCNYCIIHSAYLAEERYIPAT